MKGNIYDYQMSSLLMAIVIKGMTDNEIFSLTKYVIKCISSGIFVICLIVVA